MISFKNNIFFLKHIFILIICILCSSVFVGCETTKYRVSDYDPNNDENYFTYLNRNEFHKKSLEGLVFGKVTIDNSGCVFSLISVDDKSNSVDLKPINLNVYYTSSHIMGLSKIEKQVKTVYIIAGNHYPDRTLRALGYNGLNGALMDSIKQGMYCGVLGFCLLRGFYRDITNFYSIMREMPIGWFFINLPEGNYQLVNIQNFFYSESYGLNSKTYSTVISSIPFGPTFSVKPQYANYIGNIKFKSIDKDHASQTIHINETEAINSLKIGLKLSCINRFNWPVITNPSQIVQ